MIFFSLRKYFDCNADWQTRNSQNYCEAIRTKTGLRGASEAGEVTNQELRFVLPSKLRTTRLDVLFEGKNSFMFVL